MNREDIKQTMLLAMSEHHSGNAAEAQRIVDAILSALEAAGVRLVPVAWTDDDQTGLNAAVYDAMWHWEDRPIDVDDAMSLASALKASISDNGLMIVSAALKETGQ